INQSIETSRQFFALWPSAELQQKFAETAQMLHLQYGGRLIPAVNIHLTLVFVGAVEKSRIPRLVEAANMVRVTPFQLRLDRIGSFHGNKIAWLAPTETPPELSRLVESLRTALRQSGFSFDEKPFVPHISLLRKSRSIGPGALNPPIEWAASGFALIESHSAADGVRYEVIKRFGE
ncbi:MAG: RNA 2',3'-cyclic phosphodiesterase, partial [Burkholderiales bacterium]